LDFYVFRAVYSSFATQPCEPAHMMYLPRVMTQTQFKSESLKLRENTIKENSRKVGR